MNDIPERQNKPRELKRLAAQRQLYSEAKKLEVARIITALTIPLVFAPLITLVEELTVYVALLGVIAVFFDLIVIQ